MCSCPPCARAPVWTPRRNPPRRNRQPFASAAKSVLRRSPIREDQLGGNFARIELWRTVVAPDVEWIEAAGFPLAGTYRTPDGVISGVFEQLAAAWDDWITHDDTYVVDGERVVVLGRYSAVNKATGKTMSVRVAHRFIVRDGKIVRFEQIVDSASVRAAMTA
ncbi:nuclear transport factor 2 family protein [Streptomyces sp. NPDC088560]|uniref:nuclear transport factor 2 family protein n=1 Tax=Streptomyces sp. NPDC088560 TaxID=3365868 RepID=UPI00381FF1F3